MILKLPTFIAVFSVARFCLSAPAIEINKLSARESFADVAITSQVPYAVTDRVATSSHDIVGIAQYATEICGCPSGKVGYFIHGNCACSGDPIGPSYEPGLNEITGPELQTRDAQNGAPPTQIQYHYPPCNSGFKSWKDGQGNYHCSPPLETRRWCATLAGNEQSNGDPCTPPPIPDWLAFYKNDVHWQIDCVALKKCDRGFRGHVVPVLPGSIWGHCLCQPAITNWATATGNPGLLTKRETIDSIVLPSTHSPFIPFHKGEHDAFMTGEQKEDSLFRKRSTKRDSCDRGWHPVRYHTSCICYQDGTRRRSVEKRNAPVTNEVMGEHLSGRFFAVDPTCFNSQECTKDGRHGFLEKGKCVCSTPSKKSKGPGTVKVPVAITGAFDIEDSPSMDRTVKKRDLSAMEIASEQMVSGASLWELSTLNGRIADIQVSVVDDSTIIPFPPQQTSNGPGPYRMCPDPQCPYGFIFHPDRVGKCIDELVKRQGSSSCEDFSCPAGFVPKLNGKICDCRINRDSPFPQGPASLGPHGGIPGGYEEDQSSVSVSLDGEVGSVQKREAHLISKRQDSGDCKNLGCPAGFIPYMGSEGCYCDMDGGFPYPQAPASMGPQGLSDPVTTEQNNSPVPTDIGDEVLVSRQHSSDPKKKRQSLDICRNLGCPTGYIPTLDGNTCSCTMDGGFPYPQAPASLGPQYLGAVNEDENNFSRTAEASDSGTDQD